MEPVNSLLSDVLAGDESRDEWDTFHNINERDLFFPVRGG